MASYMQRFEWGIEWADRPGDERQFEGTDERCQDGMKALRDCLAMLADLPAQADDPMVVLVRQHVEHGRSTADYRAGQPAPTRFDCGDPIPKRYGKLWERACGA